MVCLHRTLHNKENTFTICSNFLLDSDCGLSDRANMMVVRMFRNKLSWNFNPRLYAAKYGLSLYATYKALKEAEEKKHLIRFQPKQKNRYGRKTFSYTVHLWFEVPYATKDREDLIQDYCLKKGLVFKKMFSRFDFSHTKKQTLINTILPTEERNNKQENAVVPFPSGLKKEEVCEGKKLEQANTYLEKISSQETNQTLDLKPLLKHTSYPRSASQEERQTPCEEHLMFKGLGISDDQVLSFVKSYSKEALKKATGVVRNYVDTGKKIKESPTALLISALQNGWSPPEVSKNIIDVMLFKTLFSFLKSHNQLLTNHFDVNSNSNSITFSFGTSQSSFNGNDKKEFAKWIYSSLKLIDSFLPAQKKLDPATGKWYAHKYEFANDWISFLNLKRHNDCGTSPDCRLRTSS